MLPIELDGTTLSLGILLIAPLLAVGNLVVWWQTREQAMAWWAAGSLAAAGAALPAPIGDASPGHASIALALALYWLGIRSFRRQIAATSPAPPLWRGIAGILLGVVLAAADAERELALAAAIAGIAAACAYELFARRGKLARESSLFVGGLFAIHALFSVIVGMLAMAADDWGEHLRLAVDAEFLILLIGWNFGFVMLAMQRYLDLASELATYDDLTGVLNRRAFGERIRHHARLARRGAATFSVLAMDLDHFKQVNDTYGHPAGDEVLRAFVRTAQSCLRATDEFGRVGGEEFMALLPATGTDGARALAERLRRAVAEMSVPCGAESLRITVSIGVADLDRDGDDCGQLLKVADAALYEAKRRGRNRVETAAREESAPAGWSCVGNGGDGAGRGSALPVLVD